MLSVTYEQKHKAREGLTYYEAGRRSGGARATSTVQSVQSVARILIFGAQFNREIEFQFQ